MPATVYVAKVVGTVSIGLWAGYNFALTQRPTSGSGGSCCCSLAKMCAKVTQLVNVKCCEGSQKTECKEACADKKALETTEMDPSVSIRRIFEFSLAAAKASAFSGLALVGNAAAYYFASRSGKHPYLIYVALGAPLVGILQYYGARELRSQASPRNSDEEEGDGASSDLSASSYEHVPSPSGSTSKSGRSALSLEHKYSIYSSVVSGLSAFLFGISVIGLAGESPQL